MEGLPSNQPQLLATLLLNVALFTVGVCHENPGLLSFTKGAGAVGRTDKFSTPEFLRDWHGVAATLVWLACVPLQLIMEATGLLHFNLFSLDVESAQLAVQETIDWS